MAISDRGFASMSKAKRQSIASMGGKKAHALGVAHKWNKETAAEAGRKGGLAKKHFKADDESDAA